MWIYMRLPAQHRDLSGADLENLMNEAAIQAARNTEHISSRKILINHLLKSVLEQRRRAVSYQRVRVRSQHIMNLDMRFFSICYQM